ncbi:hypothetical protein JHK82_041966 [Glycine max]|nr:hypothetical protein JHK86_042021 [Glycine max]KAG4956257.1 hypothetical protein JHK85_042637 [Glycine max]KAG5104996.1 hypothetical protein JHK82_041966 [Glycine max]KAG5116120.1 hypothetical protein JHK84_042233 [Glycine max]
MNMTTTTGPMCRTPRAHYVPVTLTMCLNYTHPTLSSDAYRVLNGSILLGNFLIALTEKVTDVGSISGPLQEQIVLVDAAIAFDGFVPDEADAADVAAQ